MVSNMTKNFKTKAKRSLGNCYADGGDVFRSGNSFGDSARAAGPGGAPVSLGNAFAPVSSSTATAPTATTGIAGEGAYISNGPLKSQGSTPISAFNDTVQGRMALAKARAMENGMSEADYNASLAPKQGPAPIMSMAEKMTAAGFNPNGPYRAGGVGDPHASVPFSTPSTLGHTGTPLQANPLAAQAFQMPQFGKVNRGFAGGGTVDPVEELLRRTAQKYGTGVPTPTPAPQPSLAPTPAPAPQPTPQPRSLGENIQNRNDQLKKIMSYAQGGMVEFHGEGGPREDKIPVKFAGANIHVSDGEKGLILPTKTAQNPHALDMIEDIIQVTNDGRPPRRGLATGGAYAPGEVPPNIAPELVVPETPVQEPPNAIRRLGSWIKGGLQSGVGKVLDMEPKAGPPVEPVVPAAPGGAPPVPPTPAYTAGSKVGAAWKNLPVKPTNPVMGAVMVAPEALGNERKRAFLDDPNVSWADKARVTGHDVLQYGGAAIGGALGAPIGQALMPIPIAGGLAGGVIGGGLGAAAGHAAGEALLGDPMKGYGGEGWKLDRSKIPVSTEGRQPLGMQQASYSNEGKQGSFGDADHLSQADFARQAVMRATTGKVGDAQFNPNTGSLSFTDKSFDPTKQVVAPGTGYLTGSGKNAAGIKTGTAGRTLGVTPGDYVAKDGSHTSDWTKTADYESAQRRAQNNRIELAQIQNERMGRDPMVSRGLGQSMQPPGENAANDFSSREALLHSALQNLGSSDPGTRRFGQQQLEATGQLFNQQMAQAKVTREILDKQTDQGIAGNDLVDRQKKALNEKLERDYVTKEGDKMVPDKARISELSSLMDSTARHAHDEATGAEKAQWQSRVTGKARSAAELDDNQQDRMRVWDEIRHRMNTMSGPMFWQGPNVTSDDLRDFEPTPAGNGNYELKRLSKKYGKPVVIPESYLKYEEGAKHSFFPSWARESNRYTQQSGG